MMLERLDFWLMIITLGALAYFELRLGRFIGPIVRGVVGIAKPAAEEVAEWGKRRAHARKLPTVRLRSRPIRGTGGRFDGSLPAVPSRSESWNEPEHRSVERSALESDGTAVPLVPLGTISPAEVALIGLRLGQGMAPNAVAKSLPGYSGRKYQSYMEKVEKVQAELATLEPAEVAQETV
jgi:hypothetical protein